MRALIELRARTLANLIAMYSTFHGIFPRRLRVPKSAATVFE